MYLWNSNSSQSKYEEPYTTSNACDLKKRKKKNNEKRKKKNNEHEQ